MKKITLLALAFSSLMAMAQYNNTYDINGNTDKLDPHFVITNGSGESITVSYASDAPTAPRTDYFFITKHDASGNVIYNNRIDPGFPPNEGFTNVEALYETPNKDILVAGYFYKSDDLTEQPFLMKVDVNGIFQWSKIYFVNQQPIANSEYNKITICAMPDEKKECYFIVGAGDSDANPGVDIVTNVIKVDDSGNLIFSKKYYDGNPNSFNQLKEYPGDMEFSPDDKLYMITGRRTEYDPAKTYNMYFFAIDNTGAVVTNYITLDSKSNPIDQDMIYDKNKKWFAVTFTHDKSLYLTGFASQIGFLTIDASMTVSNQEFIWHNEGVENNGRSISMCSDGNYVICSDILDNTQYFVHNPAWLKVDPSGALLSDLLRYNVKDDVYFGHHATTYNPSSGGEEFVLSNEQGADLRMIRTDAGGKTCGMEKFTPYAHGYELKITEYHYKDREQYDYTEYTPYEKMSKPKYRKCEGTGETYRTAAATGIEQRGISENSISLYPSVMSSDNARLTVVNTSESTVKVEVVNIAGQLIASEPQIGNGTTEIALSTNGALAQGLYMVKVYAANGSQSSTSKIIITK